MPLPPEILFHRYFQNPARHPEVRRCYLGKKNLDLLPSQLAAFLFDIQNALNEALRNEKQKVREHVEHPPFHFDYIDALVPNALAFRHAGHSFIGITMPLINKLWDSSVELARLNGVRALLEQPDTPETEEALLTVMFQTQLTFVVTHEYTHHVHGHLSEPAAGSSVLSEVTWNDQGSLEEQAFEMDADAYAVYYVLAHLIAGPRRQQAIELLSCQYAHHSTQDEILFSSFVMAVGAFLFSLSSYSIDPSEFPLRTHPPQAVRLRWIMHNAVTWCKQFDRIALSNFMTVSRFETIVRVVGAALLGADGQRNWNEQMSFLRSETGRVYNERLISLTKTHIQAL